MEYLPRGKELHLHKGTLCVGNDLLRVPLLVTGSRDPRSSCRYEVHLTADAGGRVLSYISSQVPDTHVLTGLTNVH